MFQVKRETLYMGHALMENRNGLAVGGTVTHATGTAEREACEALLTDKVKATGKAATVGVASRSAEYRLNIGVLKQPFLSELDTEARFFYATKGGIGLNRAVLVDPDRPALHPQRDFLGTVDVP